LNLEITALAGEDEKKGKRGRPTEKEPNDFGKWILAAGLTRDQVAAKLGVSLPYLHQLIHGLRRPSIDLALEIETLTDKAIPVEFWKKLSPPPRG
jgi:hypothetical protein